MHAGYKMANEVLKEFFQEMHLKIATSINPNSIMDLLFSKKVVSSDDYHRLREVPVIRERCRDLLSLLHASSHPRTFIYLRLALLDEYSWIVEEIDKKLPSLTSQLQQLHLDNSSDGNFCYNLINQCKSQDRPHCLSRHFKGIFRIAQPLTSLFPSRSLPLHFSSSVLPLPKIQLKGLGSAVSSPSGVWSITMAANEFWHASTS